MSAPVLPRRGGSCSRIGVVRASREHAPETPNATPPALHVTALLRGRVQSVLWACGGQRAPPEFRGGSPGHERVSDPAGSSVHRHEAAARSKMIRLLACAAWHARPGRVDTCERLSCRAVPL